MSDQNIQSIMKNIETNTEKLVITGMQTGKLINPLNTSNNQYKVKQSLNLVENILSSAASDFEQQVGRPMTYSEMRAMWG